MGAQHYISFHQGRSPQVGPGVRAPHSRSRGAIERAFRAHVYREDVVERFSARIDLLHAPMTTASIEAGLLPAHEDARLLAAHPSLTQDAVASLRAGEAVCWIATEGEDIVASVWVSRSVPRDTPETEHLHLILHPHEHLLCHAHVHPDRRGHGLLGHLIHRQCRTLPAHDELWALVPADHHAAQRALQKIGMTPQGGYATRHVLGDAFTMVAPMHD